MIWRPYFLTLAFACAACGGPQSDNGADAIPAIDNQVTEAPANAVESIEPGDPGGLPDDRTPVTEGAIDAKSAQGAGQVLQRYFGLLEQRRFAEAYRLVSDGWARGQSGAQFVADHDRYAEFHGEVGTPGAIEGAAGSSYVDIPVRVYGMLKDGRSFSRVQSVTLRRVNDVPGSTEDQRRWHLDRVNLQPTP